jgi:thioester reductase-like protein
MSDLWQRVANLSLAKRELLLLKLKQRTTFSVAMTAMTVEQMKDEAFLDPAISPGNTPVARLSEPASLLLTGATGFVGAFLLNELLQQTQASIYCLVRASNAEEGRNRIQKNLESYLLWNEGLGHRIIPIVGDLSQPFLGFSTQQFDMMATQMDVIYHCGALVKWTYPFSVLQATNVLGTQEVLRLASHIKVKPVHFISTIGVFSSPTYTAQVLREHEDLEHSGPLYVGYAQSKWVAEKLVRTAHSRGLPVCIYRPGIGGHSQTGVFNVHDHVCLMIKGCIQIGSVPDLGMTLQIAPVDYVSRAIVHLSKQQESLGKTFHLVNPTPIQWVNLFNWIRDYGYPLQQVSYNKWKAKLVNQVRSSQDNALYALSPLVSDSIIEKTRLPQFDCRDTLDGLAGTDIICPPIDSELLNTYFSYFIRSGFLGAP